MRYIPPVLALMAALMLPAPAAHAVPMTFVAHLSGANEVPANDLPATGLATVVLDTTAHTIQISTTFSGLTTNTVQAHIHCCLPSPLALVNVGVATRVPAFPGFPLGVTSGDYTSAVFDLTLFSPPPGGDPGIYNPAFVTLQGGLPQAMAALEMGIQNQRSYFNIHTERFPGGEERDFLGLLVAVPEPASLVLLGSALLGFGFMRRRKVLQTGFSPRR